MLREEMISEISVRREIPMETVDEVLEEQDALIDEEISARKRKKKKCLIGMLIGFLAGAAVALIILDKKEKINIEESVKKYTEKYMNKFQDKFQTVKEEVVNRCNKNR